MRLHEGHRALDPDVVIDWLVADGDRATAGTVLATLSGRVHALVSAERAVDEAPDAARQGEVEDAQRAQRRRDVHLGAPPP